MCRPIGCRRQKRSPETRTLRRKRRRLVATGVTVRRRRRARRTVSRFMPQAFSVIRLSLTPAPLPRSSTACSLSGHPARERG